MIIKVNRVVLKIIFLQLLQLNPDTLIHKLKPYELDSGVIWTWTISTGPEQPVNSPKDLTSSPSRSYNNKKNPSNKSYNHLKKIEIKTITMSRKW